MTEKKPCLVCGHPTASKWGICQATRECRAAVGRAKTGNPYDHPTALQPCKLCGHPTASKYGYCQTTPKCRSAYTMAARSPERDRTAEKAAMRVWRRANPKVALWHNARQRAARKGLPFSITIEDIHIPEYCPILGLKLEMNDGKPGPNSPSLDQIRPGHGYVPGNVQVISHQANTMKSYATDKQLLAFADWIYKSFSMEG